jgi:uncharacterized membrane protein
MALNLRLPEGRRGVVLALFASLAVNAFLAGLLIQDWMKPPQRGGLVRVESSYVIDRLPAQRRAEVSEELRDLAPELRPQWTRLRTLRREIADLAAAPTPDAAAIDKRLAEIRAITSSVQEQVQRRLFDAVLRLPPDTRKTLTGDES